MTKELDGQYLQAKGFTSRLIFRTDGDKIRYNFSHYDTRKQPLSDTFRTITRTSLSDCLGRIQSILKPVSEHIIWNKLGYRIDAPQSEGETRAFREFMGRIAMAGSILYESLATDDDCRQLLEAINDLPHDSRLCIYTDCAFLPWEILYPHHYHFDPDDDLTLSASLQVEEFWGYRYSIECLLNDQTDFNLQYDAHQNAHPFISCNFNLAIDEEIDRIDKNNSLGYRPVRDQVDRANRLKNISKIEICKTGQEIKKMLNSPDCEATIIYLYCHGSNDKPLQEGQKEVLALAQGVELEPHMLSQSLFKNGPIVFLNSCSSGAFSPLAFSTFLRRFRKKGALGLIATHFPIPAAFAAKFGWEIIEKYIQPPTKTLGDVLLQERRRLLDAGNPLGLFYSLQCPMNITARADSSVVGKQENPHTQENLARLSTLITPLEEARKQVGADDQDQIQQVQLHLQQLSLSIQRPDNVAQYHVDRIREWSEPRYQLDKRFVNLTLILDQGKDNPHRWQDDDARFSDLRDAFRERSGQCYPAFVLLGAPGSGKSTLLRRLQLDHSLDRLRDGVEQISFFTQLNEYRAEPGKALLPPREWLHERWKKAYPLEKYPLLAPLETYLKTGRVLLLLDALNEMPHRSADHYFELVGAWQAFTQEVCAQGNRLVYSCRSLDYSANLSSDECPVPHIRVQPMTELQVEQFLQAYCPAHAKRILKELSEQPQDKRQAQMELYQTPYFLKLLCDQVQTSNQIPKGRAALFTGYVRELLDREVRKKGALSRPGVLLTQDDFTDITQGFDERHPFALPEDGLLVPKLSQLAFDMQQTGNKTDGAHISKTKKEVYDLLAHEQANAIYDAGMALNILDTPDRINIKFFHQLLQEYFAARHLKQEPDSSLVRVEWKANKASPSLAEKLATLPSNDPLPLLPQTGWEETTLIAAPMATNPVQFIRDLMPHNLPLAARCAASPELTIEPKFKREIQDALIERTQDVQTDLRARISAGEALGVLGDPRFILQHGDYGEYLMPPMVKIAGDTYPIGDDNSDYGDESPAHTVELAPFEIGQFPVTNAEYARFMAAGGYDDKQWWDTSEALQWLCEGGAEGQKQSWRLDRETILSWPDGHIETMVEENSITPKQAEDWTTIRNWSEEEFEAWLSGEFSADEVYRQPQFWDDTSFNNPAQPVVGVTWFEARAYCNWLSAKTGQTYRLPTEVEFEAAARGKQGRAFPYGNSFDASKCNTFESHIRRTTPVGIFANATPEEAFDLSGNAYTWASSIYDPAKFPYPYRSDDGREDSHQSGVRRVLRGGAWFNRFVHARAAYRNDFVPAVRSFNFGFRVCRVGRPPSSL